MRYRNLCCLLSMCALVLAAEATAGDLSKRVPAGASFGDVITLWGEPVEKVDEGVLKQTIWYYKDGGKVVFKNGRVRSFRPTNAIIAQQQSMMEAQAKAEPAASEVAGETRDLVRDIAKEVPSGPDVPYVEAPAAQAPQVINANPVASRGGAPAIVPGDEVLEEQD
jgi:hypothetical protein